MTTYLELLSSNLVFNSHLGADLIFWSHIPPPPSGGAPRGGAMFWGYVGCGHIFKGIKLNLGVKTLFGCEFYLKSNPPNSCPRGGTPLGGELGGFDSRFKFKPK